MPLFYGETVLILYSGINTLETANDEGKKGGHSSGEDFNEGRQAFYVGGSEHSGQNVLRPNDAERKRAQKLFDTVRKIGAEEMTPEEAATACAESRRNQVGGYRLGTSADPIEHPVVAPQVIRNEPIIVHVRVWENGFTVDDGPLRAFEDPASRQFLISLQLGAIPPELQLLHPGRRIDLHLERTPTPYVMAKEPFSGPGMRLAD